MKKEFDVNNLKFRKCKNSDYSLYYKLMTDYIKQTKARDSVNPGDLPEDWKDVKNKLFIVLNNNEKIGTFLLDNKKSYLYISRVHIIKKFRNKGIGSYLLKYFEDKTKKKRLRLHVWPNNPAVRLYKRFGYKVIKEEKNGKLLMEKIK